jgi:hypothetical protein
MLHPKSQQMAIYRGSTAIVGRTGRGPAHDVAGDKRRTRQTMGSLGMALENRPGILAKFQCAVLD